MYIAIPLSSFCDEQAELDLFYQPQGQSGYTLYCAAGVTFSQKDRTRLIEMGLDHLHVRLSNCGAFQRLLNSKLSMILQSTTFSLEERREQVAAISRVLIDQAMESPTSETLGPVFDFATSLGDSFQELGSGLLGCLIDMSGHDFSTASHMLNVSVGCGLLAKKLCPDDHDFVTGMVRAGLVHDIGKVCVPQELLTKEDTLEPDEFAQIAMHPIEGHRILRDLGYDDPMLIEVTRDHHEHLAGCGYPRRVGAEQIGLPARIAAVVDVYDALTSSRPYRDPIAWQDALDMMSDSSGSQFDPKVLAGWNELVASLALEHKDELPIMTSGPGDIDLIMPHDEEHRQLISSTKSQLGMRSRYSGVDRRRAERKDCRIRGAITPLGIGFDGSIEAQVLDLSSSGVRFISPSRIPEGAKAHLRATIASGKAIDATLLVVRAFQRESDELWEHGCEWCSKRIAA